MYAVIETGGKQYRVEVGTELEVELLDVEPGQALTLERVLLVGDGEDTAVGRPVVANAAVEAEVVRRDRGAKLIVYKYQPKARRRVKKGHRQEHTILRITDVKLGDKSAAALVARREREAKSERQRLEEAAARQAAEDAALAAKLAKRGQAKAESKAEPKTAGRAQAKAATEAAAKTAGTSEAKATRTPESKPRASRAKAAETEKADAAGSAPEAKAKAARTSRAKASAETSSEKADTSARKPKTTTDKATPRRRTKKDE
jgi:large subunit ribosomal protein L21